MEVGDTLKPETMARPSLVDTSMPMQASPVETTPMKALPVETMSQIVPVSAASAAAAPALVPSKSVMFFPRLLHDETKFFLRKRLFETTLGRYRPPQQSQSETQQNQSDYRPTQSVAYKFKPSSKRNIVFDYYKTIYNTHYLKLCNVTRCGFIFYSDIDANESETEKKTMTFTSTATVDSSLPLNSPQVGRKFIFGVDRRTKELTDFGGQKCSSDKTLISTAIRETQEESLGVFNDIAKLSESNIFENALAVTDFETIIFFWKLHLPNGKTTKHFNYDFQERKKSCYRPEVIGLDWITANDFSGMLLRNKLDSFPKRKIMYGKIRNLLRDVHGLIKSLP